MVMVYQLRPCLLSECLLTAEATEECAGSRFVVEKCGKVVEKCKNATSSGEMMSYIAPLKACFLFGRMPIETGSLM